MTEGFFINAIGLYAEDPEYGEILYALVLMQNADYLPSFTGLGTSTVTIGIHVNVANSDNVEIIINPTAFARAGAVVALRDEMLDLHQNTGSNLEFIFNQTEELPTKLAEAKGGIIKTFGRFVHMIRSITGKSNWWEKPVKTIEEIDTSLSEKAQIIVTDTYIPVSDRKENIFYFIVTDKASVSSPLTVQVSPLMGIKIV